MVAKKPDRPELPPQKPREPPAHVGFNEPKTCANCQHYKPGSVKLKAECHNTISGRIYTRAIDGCAYGFYPSVERFPIEERMHR